MPQTAFRRLAAVGLVFALGATTACSGSSSDDADSKATLTVYTDQHPQLISALTKAYTKKTGVKFNIQNDATVGQIDSEGKASPADIFLSEDPGPVAELGKAGKLDTIGASTLDQVQPNLNSRKKLWIAYAARSRVLYYNPKKISKSALPKKLLDITKPRYKGKFAWAPSGAFVATTQYLISSLGAEKTKKFLTGVKANGENEEKNGNVRDTVEAGKHAMGLSNHYYWWIKAAEVGGPGKMTSKIYHFPEKDPGNLILSSGAAILKNSKHSQESAAFLKWLTARNGGQKILESGDIDKSAGQYPVAKGTTSATVGSLREVKSPKFDMDELANQEQAEKMLKTLGMSS